MRLLIIKWILVPIGALIGYFIVKAEPAAYVLNHQVEENYRWCNISESNGNKSSVGVALSVALATVRVLWGIPIMYFLIPICAGYRDIIFIPKILRQLHLTRGVAGSTDDGSIPSSTCTGACAAVGGNIVEDAFGVVAMVAMTPLITIQILGVVYKIKQHTSKGEAVYAYEAMDEDAIIEL